MTSTPAQLISICVALAGFLIPGCEPVPTIQWFASLKGHSCAGRKDGIFPDPSTYGAFHIRCNNNSMVGRVRCDKGTGLCSPVSTPEKDCEGVQDSGGFFTTPQTLCRGYYRCQNGSREDFTCPPDSYFDIAAQSCSRLGGVCYEPVCSGRVNGRYADTSHDCKRSFLCEGGMLRSVSTCPAGTRFNGSSCQSAEEVQCLSERSAVAVRIPASDPCASLPNGFQTQEDESCRGYYLCHSGQMIAKLRCAPGDFFNGVQCAPAKNSSCKSYCTGKPNGFATDLRKQCSGYVKCLNGKIVEERNCPEGTLFNGKSCVPSLLFQCPLNPKRNLCSKLKNGYHIDYMSGCTEYFYCYHGQVLVRSTCRDGKVWNGSDCVAQSEFLCQAPETWPGCSNSKEGLYADVAQSSKCRYYHYCSDGKRVRLRCPEGHIFDGKSCVSESLYTCPIPDTDCFNKENGYYPEPKSKCKSYFYCSDGQKITYVCPENQVFDNTKCVNENEFKCMTNSNLCVNKTNGYHADQTSGCHYYMYCFHGVLFTSFKCPEGQVFDGKKCLLFKQNECPQSKMSCNDAEDGLYSEPNSNCKKYFKCVNKKRTKTFTCREGKVFNGVKCVRYTCPTKSEPLIQREDCDGRIGFFQDYQTKCNTYYFCINGAKTALSCKTGEVFNGDLCVSENNYTCPFD